MRKRLFCLFLLLLLLAALLPPCAAAADAAPAREGERAGTGAPERLPGQALSASGTASGYQIVIQDDLGLLSETERRQLREDMLPITRYGNVAFWTTDEYARDEVEQARLMRRELFGLDSGTILVINMKTRKVSIQSYGRIEHSISIARANTITNNVRGYLTRGEYYQGASTAFRQIYRVLEGENIPQPMKYLSNLCIALMLSLIILLPWSFRWASTFRKGDPMMLIQAGTLGFACTAVTFQKLSKYERSTSSDSGSSGSSCSSCSSGSSCSSCGSGGSSSF